MALIVFSLDMLALCLESKWRSLREDHLIFCACVCKDKYVSTSMIDWRPRAKAILNEQ